MAAVDQLFLWVLATSWSASLLILFVCGAVRLLGLRLSAGWRYGLWLLIVARLVLPTVPEFRWGLANPVDQIARTGKLEPTRSSEFGAIDVNTPRPAPFDISATKPGTLLFPDPRTEPAAMPDNAAGSWIAAERLLRILATIWLLVAAALAVRMLWQTWRFLRFVRKLPVAMEGPVAAIFAEATRTLGARCPFTLVVDPRVGVPMLVGLFRPRLLLPTDLVSQLTADELRMVLLHEPAHAKRRDVVIQAACQLLRIVHWFNPIVRFGLTRVETACESACDAAVLKVLGRERSLDYGRTLLNVLDAIENRMTSSASASVAGTVGIMSRTSAIEERISMIVHGKKDKRGAHGLGVLTVLTVGLIGLTGSRSGLAADSEQPKAGQPVEATPSVAKVVDAEAPRLVIETHILKVNKPLEGYRWEATQARIRLPYLDQRVSITSSHRATMPDGLDKRQEILIDAPNGKAAAHSTVSLVTCRLNDENRDLLVPRSPDSAMPSATIVGEPTSTNYGRATTFTREREVPFVVAVLPIKSAGAMSIDPVIQCCSEQDRIVVTSQPGKDAGGIRLQYKFSFSEVAWPVRTLEIKYASPMGTASTGVQMPEIRCAGFESETEIPLGSSLLVGGMTWTDSEGGSHPLYVLVSARAVEK